MNYKFTQALRFLLLIFAVVIFLCGVFMIDAGFGVPALSAYFLLRLAPTFRDQPLRAILFISFFSFVLSSILLSSWLLVYLTALLCTIGIQEARLNHFSRKWLLTVGVAQGLGFLWFFINGGNFQFFTAVYWFLSLLFLVTIFQVERLFPRRSHTWYIR